MGRRKSRPRADRDLRPAERQEVRTYLFNADALSAMSARFAVSLTPPRALAREHSPHNRGHDL